MAIALSSPTKELANRTLSLFRSEYRDNCQNRSDIEAILEHLEQRLEGVPMAEAREVMRVVQPLRRYSLLAQAERMHRLTEVGRELGKLIDPEKSIREDVQCAPPPAQRREMSVKTPLTKITILLPRYLKYFQNLNLQTLEDLLTFFPRRWEDRRHCTPINKTIDGAIETVRGTLGTWYVHNNPKNSKMSIQENTVQDDSGSLQVCWFNQDYLARSFSPGCKVNVVGKVERNIFRTKMNSPEMENLRGQFVCTNRIVPVYPLSGRLTQSYIRNLQYRLVPTYAGAMLDPLPSYLAQRHNLLEREQAIIEMHWPSSYNRKDEAQKRLAFEELFIMQMQVLRQRQSIVSPERVNIYHNTAELTREFTSILPFTLTKAQQRVCEEIRTDLESASAMNRLVQGDVGSGKTIVAAYAAFLAIKNGYQAALMAPTEILATQHYHKLCDLFAAIGIKVSLLQGSMSKKQKLKTYEELTAGSVDLVVGTHAVIQEGVQFRNLGMTIVDEQHKFGVMQRTTLRQKGELPDLLVMTATPIPRTMSLTMYGDLDCSRIDELPPGRLPIKSNYVSFQEREQVLELIRSEINKGRQAYIVCPLIDENDKIEAQAAIQECDYLRQHVYREFSVGLLHGKMKSAEKDEVMEKFKNGIHKILISTTVIEVGVDVPNATIMLIENADRFGLAQLHQLRGRIGRGSHQSRCLFMAQAQGQLARRKLKAIARLSDGFEIAEEDLDIRGPGDYYGTRQSGLPELKIADLMRDSDLLLLARQDALELLRRDPELTHPAHQQLAQHLSTKTLDINQIIH